MQKKLSFVLQLPVLFGFFIMGFVDLVGIATNYVKKDFSLSDSMANMLPMMLFVWFAVLAVPTGLIMNKLGRKNTVLISMFLSLIAMLLPYFSYSHGSVLVAFSLLGIGNTIIQVALNPLLSNVVSGDRLASSITFGQFVKAIAAFMGPLIASYAALQFGSWKLIFPIYAAITVIASIWLIVTPIPREATEHSQTTYLGCFKLLQDKIILILFAGIVLVVGIDVGLNTSIPKFLIEKTSISLEKASWGISLYFIARTIGSFVGALLLVRISAKKFLMYTIIVLIPLFMIMLLVSQLWLLFTLTFFVGLLIANVFSIIFSVAIKRLPERANEVSGLMVMGIAGGALIPMLMGIISDASNQTFGFAVLLLAIIYLVYTSLKLQN